jgi:eukaryotic-like serine/threonine-protein kinase
VSERDLFLAALQRDDPAERTVFLDRACPDPALRQRLEVLLAAHARAGEFLERPAVGAPATDDYRLGPEGPPPILAGLPVLAAEGEGSRLGPYKLLRKLGEGGMGSVWLAQQHEPVRRQVALKVIKAGMDSVQVLGRFEAERQALALMDHPHIARVLDAGATEAGRPYFVMELVKGVPLTQFCDREGLTLRERLELFVPVCQAVQHAHQKGVIHRDLKPSNVLVCLCDGKPIPKVIDFGVAKATGPRLTEQTVFTEVGQMVGTLEYMAPEQAELNNLDIDTRADVYALGVVLYELLTGSPPFTAGQLRSAAFTEMLRMIREVEPPRPSTRLSGSAELPAIAAKRKLEPQRLTRLVRGELDWIVMKCLEKERTRRYETANALARDVERYLADELVEARPPSAGYRLRKFVRRNRGRVLAAALLLLALVGGVIGTTLGLVEAQHERDEKEKARQAEAAQRRKAEQARGAEAKQRRLAEANAKKATEERDRATEAEADTQAFGDFLVNHVLAAARPEGVYRGIGVDAKLSQALEAAQKKIGEVFKGRPKAEARARHALGGTWLFLGKYREAEEHLRRAVALREQHLGRDHPDTLTSKNGLGMALNGAGKTAKAITLLEQVRAAAVTRVGPEHPNTLTTLVNLASAYQDAGRTAEAIQLLEQARDARMKRHGPDHLETVATLHHLANAYQAAGRTTEAIPLLEQVRNTHVKRLGPDHPETLATLNNLGAAYQGAGKTAEAIQLLERVRDAAVTRLGPEHPQTLATFHNLAASYQFAGRTAEAITLLERARDAWVTRLGPEHPHTLRTLDNLAWTYGLARRIAEAIQLFEQVRDARVKLLGPEHPSTLITLHGLASAYQVTGRTAEAIPLFEQVRDARVKRLGPDHPDTVSAFHNLAGAYQDARRTAEAITLFERARDARVKLLGRDHPDTLATLHHLAVAYQAAGRTAEAIQLFEQVRDGRAKRLGRDHPDTLTTLHSLASAYREAGRTSEAIKLLEQVRDGRLKRLRPDHPQTLTTLHSLAVAYWLAKKLDRSVPLFEEVLQKRIRVLGKDHPDTLLNAVNLAVNYRDAHRLPEAARVIGEWHPRARARLGVAHSTTHFAALTAASIHELSGDFARAAEARRELLAAERKLYKPDDPRLAGSLALLGLTLLKAGKPAEAEPVLRECLAVRAKKQPDDWLTFNTKAMLGGALVGQKKYAEAEPLLLAGYEGMKQREARIPKQGKVRLTEALEHLVRLYDAWGRPESAAEWRKRLGAERPKPPQK